MTRKIQYMKICSMWVKEHLGLKCPSKTQELKKAWGSVQWHLWPGFGGVAASSGSDVSHGLLYTYNWMDLEVAGTRRWVTWRSSWGRSMPRNGASCLTNLTLLPLHAEVKAFGLPCSLTCCSDSLWPHGHGWKGSNCETNTKLSSLKLIFSS